MRKSKHKLEKELKRAERHKDWLRKNMLTHIIESKRLMKVIIELVIYP